MVIGLLMAAAAAATPMQFDLICKGLTVKEYLTETPKDVERTWAIDLDRKVAVEVGLDPEHVVYQVDLDAAPGSLLLRGSEYRVLVNRTTGRFVVLDSRGRPRSDGNCDKGSTFSGVPAARF